MKNNALEPEEPFSGETISVEVKSDKKKVNEVIEYSRKQYAKKFENREALVVIPELVMQKGTPSDLPVIPALP